MYSETLQGSNVCFLLFVTILIYGLRVLGSLTVLNVLGLNDLGAWGPLRWEHSGVP